MRTPFRIHRRLLALAAALLIWGAMIGLFLGRDRIQRALDLRGGLDLEWALREPAAPDRAAALQQARQLLENRVELLGVAHSRVLVPDPGGDRLVVRCSDLGQPERERLLRFGSPGGRFALGLVAEADPTRGQGFATEQAAMAHFRAGLPVGTDLLPLLDAAGDAVKGRILLETGDRVDGAEILRAGTGEAHGFPLGRTGGEPAGAMGGQGFAWTGQPRVEIQLSPKGSATCAALTGKAARERRLTALVLDHAVLELAACMEPIIGGHLSCPGGPSLESARTLALKLNGGALSANLKAVRQVPLGPGLELGSRRIGLGDLLIGISVLAGLGISLMLGRRPGSGARGADGGTPAAPRGGTGNGQVRP